MNKIQIQDTADSPSQHSEQVQLKLPFIEDIDINDEYMLSDLIFLALPSPSQQLH